MSVYVDLPFELQAAPAGFKPGQSSASTLAAPVTHTLQPVGPAFLAHKRRELNRLSFAQDDKTIADSLAAPLLPLRQRRRTTPASVRRTSPRSSSPATPRSGRPRTTTPSSPLLAPLERHPGADQDRPPQKVLKHHPDKKAGSSGLTSDDSFFKCIAKAHEILSNPEKRRQFDSVDESVDDEASPQARSRRQVFTSSGAPSLSARAASPSPRTAPCPSSATPTRRATRSNEFYDFFYNFDSWRSFEYLDKEINEGSDNRDDMRYTEKKNRTSAPAERRRTTPVCATSSTRRSRRPAHQAVQGRRQGGAPRPRRTRAVRRQRRRCRRPAQGRRGQEKAEEEAKRKAEQEAKAAEQEKSAKADAKKAKEAAKKAIKKEKKALNKLITDNNYFQSAAPTPPSSRLSSTSSMRSAKSSRPPSSPNYRKKAEAASGPDAIKAEFVNAAKDAGIANLLLPDPSPL